MKYYLLGQEKTFLPFTRIKSENRKEENNEMEVIKSRMEDKNC